MRIASAGKSGAVLTRQHGSRIEAGRDGARRMEPVPSVRTFHILAGQLGNDAGFESRWGHHKTLH